MRTQITTLLGGQQATEEDVAAEKARASEMGSALRTLKDAKASKAEITVCSLPECARARACALMKSLCLCLCLLVVLVLAAVLLLLLCCW